MRPRGAGRANEQLAIASYKLEPRERRYLSVGIEVLTLRGELISDITIFRKLDVIKRVGLPDELRD